MSTLYVIAEDETDVDVVRAILQAEGYSHIRVEARQASIQGGISRLAKMLVPLIRNVLSIKRADDCVVVLHDEDPNEPNRYAYDRIEQVCQQYADDVCHVVACQEVEAWLLGNEGVCRWLNKTPQNCDGQNDPKEALNRWIRDQFPGKRYSGPMRGKVLMHISGRNFSVSLNDALQRLADAPCARRD